MLDLILKEEGHCEEIYFYLFIYFEKISSEGYFFLVSGRQDKHS